MPVRVASVLKTRPFAAPRLLSCTLCLGGKNKKAVATFRDEPFHPRSKRTARARAASSSPPEADPRRPPCLPRRDRHFRTPLGGPVHGPPGRATGAVAGGVAMVCSTRVRVCMYHRQGTRVRWQADSGKKIIKFGLAALHRREETRVVRVLSALMDMKQKKKDTKLG